MEVSDGMDVGNTNTNTVHYVGSSPPREDLQVLLTKKKNLRLKLLRADHHRAFLGKCLKAKVTPKGLKLNRRVNPIKGAGSGDTAAKIERILKTAEEDIVETLVDHYENYIEASNLELSDLEKQIQSRSGAERRDIDPTSDRNEDILRSSLERTRNDKLLRLKEAGPSISTPRRKFGKGSLKGPLKSKWDHRAPEDHRPFRPLSPQVASGYGPAAPPALAQPRPQLPPQLPPNPFCHFSPLPQHHSQVYFPSPYPGQFQPPHLPTQSSYPPQTPPGMSRPQLGIDQLDMTPRLQPERRGTGEEAEIGRITKVVMEVVSQLDKSIHLKHCNMDQVRRDFFT